MDKLTAFIHKHGIACGGNWSAMLMSAIQRGLPDVYEQMENEKDYSFLELVAIIQKNVG